MVDRQDRGIAGADAGHVRAAVTAKPSPCIEDDTLYLVAWLAFASLGEAGGRVAMAGFWTARGVGAIAAAIRPAVAGPAGRPARGAVDAVAAEAARVACPTG